MGESAKEILEVESYKGTVSRDFCFKFFSESSSPKPLKQIRNGPNAIMRGLGGKLIHEKTLSLKSLGTVSLKGLL
jgi:hypothetical protein